MFFIAINQKGKEIMNKKLIGKYVGTFIEHLERLANTVDPDEIREGVNIIKNHLDEAKDDIKLEAGRDHVMHFVQEVAQKVHEVVTKISETVQDIVNGVGHFHEVLTHARVVAQGVHQELAESDPELASKLDKVMEGIDTAHKDVGKIKDKLEKVDKAIDQVEEVMDAVTGGAEDEEAAAVVEPGAAEEQDAPKLVIDALPEINEGGDELSSPKVPAEEELKELPGMDAASNAADNGDDSDDDSVEDLEPAAPVVGADPVAEEKDADLGAEFVGEGADMPAPEATAVPEALEVAGDTPDLGASVVSI